jgi:hypothetical protein
MAKVTKISDKLTKISDSFTVNMYDNGYMLEFSGRNSSDDWGSAKIMCTSVDELLALIDEASAMDRD